MRDNNTQMPIRAAPYRHAGRLSGFGEHRRAARGGTAMSTNENVAPPVRVKLYEHQIEAFLFVLSVFGLDEGDGQHAS
ncbi:hypothetical protein SDC9_180212 [bioreactor metagenome]|uniref:Uncharacterized protein n=1 Tax=bioreactor metagenome TaxID=1076179 RepID=A0A645H338_9ZZZZ